MHIQPFRALHPAEGLASRVACPPYDVLDTEEARRLALGNPMCFLRISRPEIQGPASWAADGPERYEQARTTFKEFLSRGWLVRDPAPSLYLYRQVQGQHMQTGIVALCSVKEYDAGVIRKHEHTRTAPETDRTRHMEAIGAQPGPVFLAFRDDPKIAAALASIPSQSAPFIDYSDPDGVRHRVWRVPESSPIPELFRGVDAAYIADGHHRAAAASRVSRKRRTEGAVEPFDGFLCVLFPASELHICPYHRCVSDLNGRTPEAFLQEVANNFEVTEEKEPDPPAPGEMVLWLGRKSYRLRWPTLSRKDLTAALDVSVLQDRLLAPILGIQDPRSDVRISFVGGLNGAAEVRRRVETGRAVIGFVLAPVGIGDLMAIADLAHVMPPKSTWFEPKLRSGLLIHVLDGAGCS